MLILSFFDEAIETGTFWEWLMGPYWKAYWSQPFIYVVMLLMSMIPLLNILFAFLFGWWAVAEYYDYNYGLFEGPQIPAEYSS